MADQSSWWVPGRKAAMLRRADGQEYLFMGDTASNADNVRLLRIRSHYVTDWIGKDDREAVIAQTLGYTALRGTSRASRWCRAMMRRPSPR